jgi:hypothetical protein
LPEFDRPSVQCRSLLIPLPLGFGIGPQTIRKTCVLRVSAISRPTRLSCNFRHRGTAGLAGHLDYTRNFHFPHIAVGLGRCSVATRVALFRTTGLLPSLLRTRLAPNGSSRQDFRHAPSQEFPFRANPDLAPAEQSFNRRSRPGHAGQTRSD